MKALQFLNPLAAHDMNTTYGRKVNPKKMKKLVYLGIMSAFIFVSCESLRKEIKVEKETEKEQDPLIYCVTPAVYKTTKATISFHGQYEVDGCGIFIEFDSNKYKPNAEKKLELNGVNIYYDGIQSEYIQSFAPLTELPVEIEFMYSDSINAFCGFRGENTYPAIEIASIKEIKQ